MVAILVNGEERRIPSGKDLRELLRICDIDPDSGGLAVACNDRVIRRGTWSEHVVSAGDRYEVITAMQGG